MSKIENLQNNFIKILVDIEKKTLETIKPRERLPTIFDESLINGTRVRAKKKLSKKQANALKYGRQILKEKHRNVSRLKPKI